MNPFALGDDEFLGLLGNIPRLEAKKQMDRAVSGEIKLTAEGWYDVVFRATGDRDQAEAAASEYMKACYRANVQPQ